MNLTKVHEIIELSDRYSEDFRYYKECPERERDYIKLNGYDFFMTQGDVDDYGKEYLVIEITIYIEDIIDSIINRRNHTCKSVFRLFNLDSKKYYLIKDYYWKETGKKPISLIDFSGFSDNDILIKSINYIFEHTNFCE